MTVYSGKIPKTKLKKKNTLDFSSGMTRMSALNLFLSICCLSMIVGYLWMSNRTVGDRFAVKLTQNQLREVSEQIAVNEALLNESQKADSLLALIRQNGMIQNTDAQTLFITKDVAFLP